MEHHEVFRTIMDPGLRRRVDFIWEFYQVEEMPIEGTHYLGLDWAYSLDMQVRLHFIINMKLLESETCYHNIIQWYCSLFLPKVNDTGVLDLRHWGDLHV